MREARVPYKKIIFVCTHTRPDEAACANAGHGANTGTAIVAALREEVKTRGLEGQIRVAKSGCMDICAAGPNVMCFDGQSEYSWQSGVTLADLPGLVDQWLKPVANPVAKPR